MQHEKLRLSGADKLISGTCGGIGRFLNIDSTLVRIVFVLLAVIFQGIPILVYFIMWAVIPSDSE